MPNKEFEFKAEDLILLRRFYKKSPKLFGRSVTNTLNQLAFESRTALINAISEQMTVRDNRFVNRQMRVDQAKGVDIRTAESEVGSISSSRFSGWIEQETGKKPETNRAFTLLARGGSEQNKARPKARAKPYNNFAKISDFTIKAKSRQHRLIIFLQMMVEQKKQFIMPRKYKGMGRGIYRIKRKKIVAVQRFGPVKIRKAPWMKPTIQRDIDLKNIRTIWSNNINRVLPRRLK